MNRIIFLLIAGLICYGCGNDEVQDELPPAAFGDITINLSLPQYQDLAIDGGFEYVSAGLRGIIVYRENAFSYHAIEQNCTYLPFEAGSTVDVDNGIRLRDPSCGSIFTLPDGVPISGPAFVPLRKYSVSLNGQMLTITDEPVN